ncbi:hypothetical protein PSPO01_14103 [Paraphaeosphaeria sporulosa]
MHARAAFSSARGSENGSELQDLRLQMWGEQTCGRAGTLTGPGYLVHIFVYLFVPFGRQFPGLIRYDRRFPLPRKGHVVRNGCILLLWPGLRPVWESVLLFSLKPGLGDFELSPDLEIPSKSYAAGESVEVVLHPARWYDCAIGGTE